MLDRAKPFTSQWVKAILVGFNQSRIHFETSIRSVPEKNGVTWKVGKPSRQTGYLFMKVILSLGFWPALLAAGWLFVGLENIEAQNNKGGQFNGGQNRGGQNNGG